MRRTCVLGLTVFLGSIPSLAAPTPQTPSMEPSAFAKAVIAEITSNEDQFFEAAQAMPHSAAI